MLNVIRFYLKYGKHRHFLESLISHSFSFHTHDVQYLIREIFYVKFNIQRFLIFLNETLINKMKESK